jgi:hypothetical protein
MRVYEGIGETLKKLDVRATFGLMLRRQSPLHDPFGARIRYALWYGAGAGQDESGNRRDHEEKECVMSEALVATALPRQKQAEATAVSASRKDVIPNP